MKKLFYLIIVMVVLGLIVTGCIPVVPPAEQGEISGLKTPAIVERGFDEYGYNYNARLFNGWYGSWWDKKYNEQVGTLNAWIVMKWSKDWAPMADEPIGAWCTNHWLSYSDDYEESTWYGWDTRKEWTEKSLPPEAEYRMEEFLKIMKVGDNENEWERYMDGGAYSAMWGNYDSGVPKYVVFQDTIDIYDASTGDLVATFDLCTASPKGLGQPIF
jgi:hypothetical protein